MGRAFEKRKHKMFANNAKASKAFTRIGKEIAIAVKLAGPNPDANPRLRMVLQNAKSFNMPKDRVEAAIARAANKDEKDLEEVVFEGYGPHGVAIVVEAATDNNTRTVANIRMHFNRGNGALGKTGSLDFLFDRKGIFKIDKGPHSLDDLELELIDFGAEEVVEEEDGIYVTTSFTDFGKMQKGLEEKGITIASAELDRIPTSTAELSPEQQKEVHALIERLEDDDDVQNVFHNMKED
ncbi:MAG: YebC/PmpR family DNA-binding transcriptional regulator [Bacteroidia bacterium]|nr:YebC/PmpR family DNA-binding transcriptional regulator [Bacteroidia bacterium]